jgi:hypothetical protein
VVPAGERALRRAGEQFQVQHRLRDGPHLADVPEDLAGLYCHPCGDPLGCARDLAVADDAAGVLDLERVDDIVKRIRAADDRAILDRQYLAPGWRVEIAPRVFPRPMVAVGAKGARRLVIALLRAQM